MPSNRGERFAPIRPPRVRGMTIRFLHTADLQLGKRQDFAEGDAAAVLRTVRFETVERLYALAIERDAAFVVIAGDVFEHADLRPATVRRAFDAMRGSVPVYVLPGNHDPLTPSSTYRSRLWREECPSNVQLLDARTPVEVAPGVVLLPCPLFAKNTLGDTTAHLTADFGPADAIRIGVAHGGLSTFRAGQRAASGEPGVNLVDTLRADRAKLDYLALGDWHGLLRIDERTWYAGSPEPCRFQEDDSGSVLMVEIEGPGVAPRVAPHRVAGTRWSRWTRPLSTAADVDRLDEQLDGIEDPARHLLELTLEGRLPEQAMLALDRLLERARDRLLHLRVDRSGLRTALRDDEIDALADHGWLGEVLTTLRGSDEARSEVDDAALRLFRRVVGDVEVARG